MHGHWVQAQDALGRAAKKFYPLRRAKSKSTPTPT